MAVNIPGVILMVLFYLMVLGTGIWASFKSKREQKKSGANETEMTLLGNRSINWVVGIFTMTGEDSSAEDNRMDTVCPRHGGRKIWQFIKALLLQETIMKCCLT